MLPVSSDHWMIEPRSLRALLQVGGILTTNHLSTAMLDRSGGFAAAPPACREAPHGGRLSGLSLV